MELINLTPHVIDLYSPSGKHTAIGVSGTVVRVNIKNYLTKKVKEFPINNIVYTLETSTLPAPKKDTLFIVSYKVLQALKFMGVFRPDFIAPDTSLIGVVKNKQGHTIGTKGFISL